MMRYSTAPLLRFASILIAVCAGITSANAQNPSKKPAPGNKARSAASEPQAAARYADRPAAMAFADDMAARRDMDPAWVRDMVGQARQLPTVSRLMTPAPVGTPKNWRVYRSRFIDPVRIRAGVRFWQDNRAALERAEQEYGVPAEIIVGIIGVETIYGQQMGTFRVIDALATLAFDFPDAHPRAAERQAFFQRELEQVLSLMQRIGQDPTAPRGSFAGAMGLPQFMPSSWVRYAIDFDGDGHVSLHASAADAIGSVASYFIAHGWQPGMPTHFGVRLEGTPTQQDELLAPDILPTFSAASMQARGALLDAAGANHTGPLALVELQNGTNPPSYVAGTENFYAITRYNWSSYYAMAVIELGQAVKAAREAAR